MAAAHEIDRSILFEIFTRVPRWFFEESLSFAFSYHPLLTDVGLAQKTPLVVDIPETLSRLNSFLPFDHSLINSLAGLVRELECELVVCDIAPMGIEVARQAGITSMLVENFTWDGIYEGYVNEDTRLSKYIDYFKGLFEKADYHVQTEPVCRYRDADLRTSPVSRRVRKSPDRIRDELGVAENVKVVIITMGGIPAQHSFLSRLESQRHITFVIPGAGQTLDVRNNLILLPYSSDFFHPDLVNACDAVVGKIGYSTMAEVYYAGVAFGYVKRRGFRESKILADYIDGYMRGLEIREAEFESGDWLSHLTKLLSMPRLQRGVPNGAGNIADFICRLLRNRYISQSSR